jgi:hypothetical protein
VQRAALPRVWGEQPHGLSLIHPTASHSLTAITPTPAVPPVSRRAKPAHGVPNG